MASKKKTTDKPESKEEDKDSYEVGFSTGGGQITADQTEQVSIGGEISTSTQVGGVDSGQRVELTPGRRQQQ
jgi:hypothetical protein